MLPWVVQTAPPSPTNSATWNRFDSFNSFNGCHQFLIISDPSSFWPLLIAHSRSTPLCSFLEHSFNLTLTIINQAIFYQTPVASPIQIRIQTVQIQTIQIQTDWNMGLLIESVSLHSYKTKYQLSNVTNLHVCHSGRTIFLAHYMYHTGRVLSLKGNDFSSFLLDLRHQHHCVIHNIINVE